MEIKNPRRILAVSSEKSEPHLIRVIKEKTGIPRVLEAIEANDWSASTDLEVSDSDSDSDSDSAEITAKQLENTGNDDGDPTHLDTEDLDFGFDKKDFAGLKRAILNAGQEDDEDDDQPGTSGEKEREKEKEKKDDGDGDEDEDEELDDEEIRKIERMMTKLQAVRDTNVGLPEEQRKRAAAKAVAEVMREL
ncbi:hypothetical protein GGS20DRAFT_461706 [Poronia punctata]|nr:hypothetical protein GGS20DRAFT_461706 [Poronia punctata]